MMKRTLLVDTNRAAVPIYRALCELGHEVWVVGGKPTETLAKLAPHYVQLDCSDAGRAVANNGHRNSLDKRCVLHEKHLY